VGTVAGFWFLDCLSAIGGLHDAVRIVRRRTNWFLVCLPAAQAACKMLFASFAAKLSTIN
jgi:hypothetical protein